MTRRSVEIANTLEREILANEFGVGELMNEVALAERFGVSRTPVREALLSLTSTGLVRLEPGRGVVVVGVSIERVFESYEVMAELLGFATALAAKRMSPLAVARLVSIHEEMRDHLKDEDREDYARLNAHFHDEILKGCANAVLVQQVAECKKTIAAVRHASIESHPNLDTMYAEHDRIVKAITAGDAEAARDAMRDHVQLRGDVAGKLVTAWRRTGQNSETAA